MRGRSWLVVTSLFVLAFASLSAPAQAAFPGQNGKIAFVYWEQGYNIWTIAPDGAGLTRLGPGLNPEWSADGTKLAFDHQGEVWTMNADGSGRTQVTTSGGRDPSWSPDGSEIVFYSSGRLARINADGTNLRPIDSSPPGCSYSSPDWSPRGNRIAFYRDCGPIGLATMNPDGGDVVPLGAWSGSGADWSPGEVWLSYRDNASLGVHIVPVDGGQPTVIGLDWVSHGIAWSPDGTKLVYGTGEESGAAMFIVNTANGERLELAPGMPYKQAPTWQPLPPAPTQAGYPRPKGATPFHVALVPAHTACESPDSVHGPPLAFDSCGPPQQASTSLTVGTPDANGQPVRSVGHLQLNVAPGDLLMDFKITDVRCRSSVGGCPDGALSDYPGRVEVTTDVRVTDRWNGGSGVDPATTDLYAFMLPFRMGVDCQPTADPQAGSTCALNTTVNALVPGIARAGKRSIWGLGAVQVLDSGPDGEPTSDDNEVFAVQGLFVP